MLPRLGQLTLQGPSAAAGSRCFIGVDLGTSKSGYTYALGNEASQIKTPPTWTSRDQTGAPKTDTALLYKVLPGGHWQLDCWGKAATEKYIELADPRCFRLIKGSQFKLALSEDSASLPPEFQLPYDCPFTSEQLITRMLTCLREHATNYLSTNAGLRLDSTDMYYCLSVPAGWSDAAKDVMRRSAHAAGMTLRADCRPNSSSSSSSSRSGFNGATLDTVRGSIGSRDQWEGCGSEASFASEASYMDDVGGAVVLVHEQEAAALTACCDPLKALAADLKAVPGDVWVVLDAGGGTVDIAMHKIEKGTTEKTAHLSEVRRSLCLLNGSTMLDQRAEEMLFRPLFGDRPDEYERWRREEHQDYITQMKSWESEKIHFDGSNDCVIPLTYTFNYALQQCVPRENLPPRGRLNVSAQQMKSLVFDPVIDPIVQNLWGVLSKPRSSNGSSGANVLVMAGGFGSSRYLLQRVKSMCGPWLGREPVTPGDANKAVVLGNTIHLQHPDTISARCSRYTYGVNVLRAPEPCCQQHGSLCKDSKGGVHCSTHFRPLIRVGEVVRVGEFAGPLSVHPAPGCKTASVDVWVTPERDARHTTEAGMRMLGTVKMDVRKAARKKWGLTVGRQSSKDYPIDLYFDFGAGDMQVRALDRTNNTEVCTTVVFCADTAAGGPVALPAA
uniref:Actin-like ATPase domain-containing protein n=1 Tax=Tetradesmus obliquus TaxID=3088 RepID=A0A383VX69_TETOB|eukprot:jgi/Sobl393_1/7483/SZX69453.1